jgi:hypothetical protein
MVTQFPKLDFASQYDKNSSIAQRFAPVAWDAIGPLIGGGEFRSLELPTAQQDQSNDLGLFLDRSCGFDGIQILPFGVCRAVAFRVQQSDKDWSTFTIRMDRSTGNKTEFDKRLDALRTPGALLPYWTIQAYVSPSGELLSVAAIETESLYLMVDGEVKRGSDSVVRIRTNGQDGNSFAVVSWWTMHTLHPRYEELGLTPKVWRP